MPMSGLEKWLLGALFDAANTVGKGMKLLRDVEKDFEVDNLKRMKDPLSPRCAVRVKKRAIVAIG